MLSSLPEKELTTAVPTATRQDFFAGSITENSERTLLKGILPNTSTFIYL